MTETPKSRFQFRLSHFLLLVAVLGVVFGVAAIKLQSYRKQNSVADEFRKHGANVGWSWAGNIVFVELIGAKITDDDLKTLERMPHLEALFLGNTPITDDSVKYLKTMRQLEMLSVSGTNMSPAGVAELKRRLPETKIVDIGVGDDMTAQTGERLITGDE